MLNWINFSTRRQGQPKLLRKMPFRKNQTIKRKCLDMKNQTKVPGKQTRRLYVFINNIYLLNNETVLVLSRDIWDKVFKNGPSNICGRIFMVCFRQTISLHVF